MTTLKLNHLNIALVAALFFILQSCVTVPGTWKDDQIPSGKRSDFHDLNTQVLKHLKNNDPNALKMYFSKEMNENNTAKKIDIISNRLNDYKYDLQDEYYVVNRYKDTDTVVSKEPALTRYKLVYPCEAREMYFAFFIPKKSDNQYMISLIYAKLSYGWKIVKLTVEPYTINGKTAPELYALAQKQAAKNEAQAALYNVSLAVSCFKPNLYWQYPDELDAEQLYTRVHQEVKFEYNYPMVLRQIATGPMILKVYNASDDNGTSPVIYYMTHFDLKDTTDIKKENMQIRGVVSKIMPGLAENNKKILYSAFNKQPNGYESIDHFDMTDKVN